MAIEEHQTDLHGDLFSKQLKPTPSLPLRQKVELACHFFWGEGHFYFCIISYSATKFREGSRRRREAGKRGFLAVLWKLD